MLKCPGCGALIQTTDKDKIGYIDENVLNEKINNNLPFLCYRCFRLKNYSEVNKVEIDEEDFVKNTKNVIDDALICNIIDCFDLEGTIIKNVNSLFPNHHILIIANKYDLFLRSNRPTKLKKYIYEYLEANNIKVDGVIVTSSVDLKGVDKLYNSLLQTCKSLNTNNNIYMFGVSNVGKSSLIKALLSVYDLDSNLVISNSISTTLGNNLIKVNELNIYDTPGIINKKQITYYLDKPTLDIAIPKKFVKPKSWQINSNQTLFVNGLASFSYYGESKVSIVTYFSNQLKIHRTKADTSNEFYEKHLDDILTIPNSTERARLGKLKEVKFTNITDCEISLSGIGFISFFGSGDIVVKTFENISVEKRKQLI